MDSVTLKDVYEAADRIRPYVNRTPLLRGITMDEYLGCEVYLKPEMLQVTGSFKMRGATNKVLSMSEEEKKKGVICISEGNHARACATISHYAGVECTVVVPDDTPKVKLDGVRKMGGKIVMGPRAGTGRWKIRDEYMKKYGYLNIHPTDDVKIIAGTGTISKEILEDMPTIDTILVPVGGGGLISGVAMAAKSINPNIKVIGVQAAANQSYVKSYKEGKPIYIETVDSLADGLNCECPEEITFPLVTKYVDDMLAVSEEYIHKAVKLVAGEVKVTAEPSSCVGVAAILEKLYIPKPGEKVCFVLSAGNWEIEKYGKLLETEPGV